MSTENKDIPQDFKRWYIAESKEQPNSEAFKEWTRRGQKLCYEVAYTEGFEEGAEAAYRHLSPSSKPEIWLRWVKASERLPEDWRRNIVARNNANCSVYSMPDASGAWTPWQKENVEWLEEFESIPSSEAAKDLVEFDKYITATRDEFVRKFWDMYPNAEKRVVAEDLLICFDQMRERLHQYSQPSPQPEPSVPLEKVINAQYTAPKK